MDARLAYAKAVPQAFKLLKDFEAYLARCGLEAPLPHLVKMRASQIIGCAYCRDMRSEDARTGGKSEQRLYAQDAWRETSFCTEYERASLERPEAVTLIREGHVPDAVHDLVRRAFSDGELANLTVAVTMINSWNRLNIAFRPVPGTYRPGMWRTPPGASSQREPRQKRLARTAAH
jgi:AhpD family alkylhydroperoxidase